MIPTSSFRSPIGQIAVNWGLIDSDQLQYLLANRKFSEKFGEYAVRNKYFTKHNLLILLYNIQTKKTSTPNWPLFTEIWFANSRRELKLVTLSNSLLYAS